MNLPFEFFDPFKKLTAAETVKQHLQAQAAEKARRDQADAAYQSTLEAAQELQAKFAKDEQARRAKKMQTQTLNTI